MADALATGEVLWTPPRDARERFRAGRYLDWLERRRGLRLETYEQAWRWSVDDLEGFWSSIWEHLGVVASAPPHRVLSGRAMPGARWFEGATLNYAQHALRHRFEGPALVARSQTRPPVEMSIDELRDAVARCAAGLRRLGVGRGDRVAAYLPNAPEAVIALLATASLGAVWSSCAPEFGTRAVTDRFGQIAPKVLIAVDGYRFGDREVDRREEVERIRAALPTLRATVVVAALFGEDGRSGPGRALGGAAGRAGDGAVDWDDLCAVSEPLRFEQVPFDHPLYILYSSGTTGPPKCIVHGHGGILVEHLKVLGLHHDLGPGDRFFWFSTTGWMMWNYLVSGLCVGSAIVLFDGNPGWPDLRTLWRLAAETRMTYVGLGAQLIVASMRAGLRPGEELDLSRVRGVGSTGSPLPAGGFRWVYEAIGGDVVLASASGGTDVCTAFVGACPLVPVYAGEISCRCLGAAVEAFDHEGRPVVGRLGELVVTAPMPSMPVAFWNDPGGERYRAAYFEDFPGVWRHGDWVELTERGTCVITGRSDATLNRGGVRIGTAELYAVVESVDGVADSLAVHLEEEVGPGRLLLFVVPRPGVAVDEGLRRRIVAALRAELSPRHVPDEVIAAPAVPRTISGKKLEVPVKRILGGEPAARVASAGSLADPASIRFFEELAARRPRA